MATTAEAMMMLSSAHQTDQTQHYCGMIAIGQFDMGGTVLSRDQVVKQRERQGLCVNCGQTRTHRHTFLVGKTAITKQGESLFGWCLKCHTTVSVLSKPGLRIKAEQKKIQWALVHHNHHHQATPSTSIGNNSSTDSSWTEESSSRVFDIVLELSTSIRSAAVQERGLNELAKAALQDSTITKEEFNAALEAIVSAMKTHSRETEVQKSGCNAIHQIIIANSEAVCTKFLVQGGVFAVVSAMKNNLPTRSIQRDAISILHHILQATTKRNKRLCILSTNELGAILDAMICHSHCKSIQVAAWDLIEFAICLEPVVRILSESDLLRSELVELAGGHHPLECAQCVQTVLQLFSF